MQIVTNLTRVPRRIKKRFSALDRVQARALAFEKKHGYIPNFYKPKTFSEKLNARILFEEDPYYLLYATKLFAPFYAAEKVKQPLSFAKRLKVKEHLAPSDFEDLPQKFVMKSSFGSGMNKIVRDKSSIDPMELCDFFNNSIKTIRNAKGDTYAGNCVIFEEMLLNENQEVPNDFKIHCFWRDANKFRYIVEIISKRFTDLRQTFLNDRNEVLDFSFGSLPGGNFTRPDESIELPVNLSNMIDIAKQLSRGFNYIRVDLFSIGDAVYFGELTPFHGGGWVPISSKEWDNRLGEMWQWNR